MKYGTYLTLWYTGTFLLASVVYLGSIVLGANPMVALLLATASTGVALLRAATYKGKLKLVYTKEQWWHIYAWGLGVVVQALALGVVIWFGVHKVHPFIDGWTDRLF